LSPQEILLRLERSNSKTLSKTLISSSTTLKKSPEKHLSAELPQTTVPIKFKVSDFKETRDQEINTFLDRLKKKNIRKTVIEDFISSPYLGKIA